MTLVVTQDERLPDFVSELSLQTSWIMPMMNLLRSALFCSMVLIMPLSNTAQDSNDQTQSTASVKGKGAQTAELTIFARFHARAGKENLVASELRDAVGRVRKERGCLGIEVYRSVRDPGLFWLHSRWVNEAAFDRHAARPETIQFVDRVQPLIDHPFDVNRTRLLFN
jgi:quinol monooxygenase YgiN